MKIKKLSFLILLLSIHSLFAAGPADDSHKRPAEEQACPDAQEEKKARKEILFQSIVQTEKEEWSDIVFIACYNNDSNPIVSLVQKCTQHAIEPQLVINEYKNWDGEHITPFGMACLKGKYALIAFLLDIQANPNKGKIAKNGKIISPLALVQKNTKINAAEKEEICKLLRSYGAIE